MRELEPLAVPLTGTQVVEASAGTGKTWTITTLVLRLLLEEGLSIQEILVVTFTRAATQELRTRLRTRLEEARATLAGRDAPDAVLKELCERLTNADEAKRRIATALEDLDLAPVWTIQAFCQRALERHAFETGARLDLQLIEDERPLVQTVLDDYWASELAQARPQLIRHLVRGEGVSPSSLLSLACKVVARPRLPVLPDTVSVDDEAIDACLERWKRAHHDAAQVWFDQKWNIKNLLASKETPLNRNHYRGQTADGWVKKLDATFREFSTGPLPLFDGFDRFTTSGIRRNTKKKREPPENPFFAAAETLWRAYEATAGPVAAWVIRFRRNMIDHVRDRTEHEKTRSHVRSFSDALNGLESALAGDDDGRLKAAIQSEFAAALIDEFQDTDPVQYDIFRAAFEGRGPLFFIGDPKQSIYRFRGADVFAYARARGEAGGEPWTLNHNYRSDPALVDAVQVTVAGAAGAADPFVLDWIGLPEVHAHPGATARLSWPGGWAPDRRAPLQFRFVRREDSRTWQDSIRGPWAKGPFLEMLAAEVVELLQAGVEWDGRPLAPSDVAILTNSNEQARWVHEALQRVGLQAAVRGEASVFATREATDTLAILRALADPGDPARVRTALATRSLGWTALRVAQLSRDEQAWENQVGRFRDLADRAVERGVLVAFRHLIEQDGIPARLLAQVGGDRSLTNLLHLAELLGQIEDQLHLGLAALAHWLEAAIDSDGASKDLGADAHQLRLESDAGAVRVMTMHAAKGLEFPVVLCPYLDFVAATHPADSDELFFHDTVTGEMKLDIGSDQHDQHLAQLRVESLAEKVRLAYVALTRAKGLCIVHHGGFWQHRTSPLAWLLHRPESAADDDHQTDAPPPSVVALLEERMRQLSDDDMLADLHALRERAPGLISVDEAIEVGTSERAAPSDSPAAQFSCRELRRKTIDGYRVGSYTSLVAEGRAGISPVAGVDRDDADDDLQSETTSEALITLAEFPRGARAGSILHGILEQIDFASGDQAELKSVAARELARWGEDAGRWSALAATGLAEVLATPLGDGAPALSQVAAGHRLVELPFDLPVRCESRGLDGRALARPLRDHGDDVVRSWSSRLEQLEFTALRGFLRGFIDSVFEHDGRWWIVDYKSNWLGPHIDDYAPQRLESYMLSGDYLLQVLLYCVAIHRYLSYRVPGFSWESHFGGVRWLFLRGMRPASGDTRGVWKYRPGAEMITALSATLDREVSS